MSSECEYRHSAVRFAREEFGLNEDLYVLSTLTGSNNTYSSSGARVRRWQVTCAGSFAQVMSAVIHFAGSCEGRGLYVGNFGATGCISPERYIARLRRLLNGACDPTLGPVQIELALHISDDQAATFDADKRSLFDELLACPVAPSRGKRDEMVHEDGKWRFTPVSYRRWHFESPAGVALFVRFRPLGKQVWPDCKAYGPGEI